MMLEGIHFLLTMRCLEECDHCFVWGSPSFDATFKPSDIKKILEEGKKIGVKWVYFEGGEPFLFYPILVKSVGEARRRGFKVGIVTNGYWAIDLDSALEFLTPISKVDDLSFSTDCYHPEILERVRFGVKASKILGIPVGIISIEDIHSREKLLEVEGISIGYYPLMFKGRASKNLADKVEKKDWRIFKECPYEDLRNPKRVHVDPYGYVHVCQGITIGNTSKTPFSEIVQKYSPFLNPILKVLCEGGPVSLAKFFKLSHKKSYADACHMCYAMREKLRLKFPEILSPPQMYGEF
ncbi:MAG: radical SAM protein [Candidatus Methanofastidiosia archaeon]